MHAVEIPGHEHQQVEDEEDGALPQWGWTPQV